MKGFRPWFVRLFIATFCAVAFGAAAFFTFGLAAACWVAAFVAVAALPYTLAVGWR